jgi:glutamine synthetase
MENALNDGMIFDGSAIDGFSRIQESDVLALPDANTFEVLPWVDPKGAEARVFCDVAKLDGTPFDGDPRQVLRRNLNAARELGYQFYVAPDIEYFYLANRFTNCIEAIFQNKAIADLALNDSLNWINKKMVLELRPICIGFDKLSVIDFNDLDIIMATVTFFHSTFCTA